MMMMVRMVMMMRIFALEVGGGGKRGGVGIGGVISAPADLSIETMFKIVMGVCLWLDNCITLHGSA